MPRHGELSNEEKARAVLTRTGRPGNQCEGLTAEEHAELAAIYDECCAPEQRLAARMDAFWAGREERLAAQKATAELDPPRRPFFRNRRLPAAPQLPVPPSIES